MVTNARRPNNHPIYSVETEMVSTIFFTKGGKDSFNSQNVSFVPTHEELEGVWNVIFDGEICREGAGAGVLVNPPGGRALNYSYKISFYCTNNEAEYEAIMLAIQILKYFQVRRVVIHGNSELVIKKMQGEY